jgi:GLPGLI family protein
VDYDFILIDEKDDYGDIRVEKLILTTNQDESLLKRTAKDTVFECELFGLFESGNGTGKKYDLFEYKNIKNKEYYFLGPYTKKIVKDLYYNVEWEIKDEVKKILNYKCQKATCNYRGRNYVVFFTSEIPIQNGPFKFDGLPGLILEVFSEDKMVKIKAKSIKITDLLKIENPFEKETTISWQEFKSKYKKYFESVINYKTDNGSEVFIPNRGIEFYTE